MSYLTKVLNKNWLADDVFQLSIKKPESFIYSIGQAVDITLFKTNTELTAPFAITSVFGLDEELQFIIKLVKDQTGISKELARLKFNDIIYISNPFDSFSYKGPGVFIAAGSGITPFIPLIRILNQQKKIEGHQLIFANKKESDIILYEELKEILDDQFYNVLSRDHLSIHKFGHINEDFLSKVISKKGQFFYVCGPSNFLKNMSKILKMLSIKSELIQTIY